MAVEAGCGMDKTLEQGCAVHDQQWGADLSTGICVIWLANSCTSVAVASPLFGWPTPRMYSQ